MPQPWMKMGRGGSYSGYYKLRNPINKVSSAQRDHRARFRTAAIACKGQNGKAAFRACMSEKL